MRESIVISGSGGQGVLFSGKLLAKAAVEAGYFVSVVPSYGAEMRGGTANCALIISDEKINNPIVSKPDSILCFNEPSLLRFQNTISENGILFVDKSFSSQVSVSSGVRIVTIDSLALAEEAGSKKIVNMPFIGAYSKVRQLISLETLTSTVSTIISEHYKVFLETNFKALSLGFNSVG